MNLFRTLLWWLLLAALGALAWELLSPDLGQVLVRWHGTTLTTTVAAFLAGWALLWFAAWVLWSLLRLPFTAWQRLAQTQARSRLINGLTALHEGRNARAESLLDKAAEEKDAASVARLAAREAALRRGDTVAAALQQAALSRINPMAGAIANAQTLLAQGKPSLALESLQAWADRRQLPPRGLWLRGQALAESGRALESLAVYEELAREPGMAPDQLAAYERAWNAALLRQSAHANELHQRWQQLPPRLREIEDCLLAFAIRAGELGLESEAAGTLADALDRQWSETLVRQFALLPPAREDLRLARAEQWLGRHPNSPGLALCLGRLCRQAQLYGKAEESLHRALAQGAAAEAWEELGHVYTALNDPARAQACYANALRSLRGETARLIGGRSLREQIADEAVAELRNEHGLPHLRS